MKKQKHPLSSQSGLLFFLAVGSGTGFGISLGNMGLGLTIGLCLALFICLIIKRVLVR